MSAVAGLSDKQLARVRPRLEAFAAEMFESMVRRDQRRWGGVYLRGLMLDGKRKSIIRLYRPPSSEEIAEQTRLHEARRAKEVERQRSVEEAKFAPIRQLLVGRTIMDVSRTETMGSLLVSFIEGDPVTISTCLVNYDETALCFNDELLY